MIIAPNHPPSQGFSVKKPGTFGNLAISSPKEAPTLIVHLSL